MGEDITKLKKNIENIKKMVEGGRKSAIKKEERISKPEGSKQE